MQKSAVILLFIPYLLDASLFSELPDINTCVGNDVKLNWKYDNPTQINAVFYKVQVPGGSLVDILSYDGAVANVINNYNVKWDNEEGPVTIVKPTLSNTGNYSIGVSYSGGHLSVSDTVSMIVLDPPKTLSFIQNGMEFTCTLGSFGTPNVSLYSQLDGVKEATPTVTADRYKKVECCINGAAVKCMSGITALPHCITAQDPLWYRSVVLALYLCVFLLDFVSIVVFALAKKDKVAPSWVMLVMTIILYVLTALTVAMTLMWIILYQDEPTWVYILLILAVIDLIIGLILLIILLFKDPWARLLRKMYCCEKMDEEERKRLAAVLVVIFWFPLPLPGLILLVPCCIKRGRFAEVVQMFWCHNVG